MTASSRGTEEQRRKALAEFDSVYFLMFPGWRSELRSNRWHFASRFARHLPVVLVQPTQSARKRRATSEAEGRIDGARVLHVHSSWSAEHFFRDAMHQTGQILEDMDEHGFSRPLIWSYNPRLFAVNASLPAIARIHHATENYYHFDALDPGFLEALTATIRLSDFVVAVSDGVAKSVREANGEARVHVVTNGCDFGAYAAARRDEELAQLAEGFGRTAIFAGNINGRLDFELLLRAARDEPRTLFALAGPVSGLDPADEPRWKELRQLPNVRHLGPVHPEGLPDLYLTADVGLVPYKQERWLVENGFPLKVLEMATTGLPVVATRLEPIKGLAAAIRVTHDNDEFITALHATDRRTLPADELDELQRVCRANDYDAKFDQVCGILNDADLHHATARTRIDVAIANNVDGWRRNLRATASHAMGPWETLARHIFGRIYSTVGNALPMSVRLKLPGRIRRLVRGALPPG